MTTDETSSVQHTIGVLQGRLEGMDKRIDRLQADTSDQNVKLDQILAIVSAAKGGLRVVIAIGSVAAALGAFVHWIIGLVRS